MMQISWEQVAAFEEGRRALSAKTVRNHLASVHPELLEGLTPQEIDARVERVLTAAEGLRLRSDRGCGLLGALMFRFGPAFPTAREVRDTVRRGRTPDAGLLALAGSLSADGWGRLATRLKDRPWRE